MGGYSANANLTSFVSVFPVDDPKYLLLVMLDEPKGNKSTFGYATAGWNAAPVAGRIIARMAPMLGVRPIYELPGDNAPLLETQEAKQIVHDVSY